MSKPAVTLQSTKAEFDQVWSKTFNGRAGKIEVSRVALARLLLDHRAMVSAFKEHIGGEL